MNLFYFTESLFYILLFVAPILYFLTLMTCIEENEVSKKSEFLRLICFLMYLFTSTFCWFAPNWFFSLSCAYSTTCIVSILSLFYICDTMCYNFELVDKIFAIDLTESRKNIFIKNDFSLKMFKTKSKFSVIVYFSEYCHSCHKQIEIASKVRNEIKDLKLINIAFFDDAVNPQILNDYNQTSVPFIVIYKNGKEIATSNFLEYDEFKCFIVSSIKESSKSND